MQYCFKMWGGSEHEGDNVQGRPQDEGKNCVWLTERNANINGNGQAAEITQNIQTKPLYNIFGKCWEEVDSFVLQFNIYNYK